jgi:hypothetical protein
MAENSGQQYLVRDPDGNVYGPAEAALLREWVQQGRIVAGMHIAPRETGEWVEVSVHPALAGCFQGPQESLPVAEVVPAEEATPGVEVGPVVEPLPQAGSGGFPVTPVGPAPAGLPVTYASDGPRQNVPALISMIAGIVSTAGLPMGCLCGCIGGPLAVVAAVAAIVLGIIGMSQIKADPQRYAGWGTAVAGVAMGIGSLIIVLVGVVVVIALGMKHP